MYPNSQEHEWDTPPNGDFVRYLERLAATAPATSPVPRPSSTAPPPTGASRSAPATAQPVLPLASQWAAMLSALHKGRTVLLWLMLAHLVAWLLFDRGSVPLLIFMAAVWSAWGWALAALSDSGHPSHRAHSGLERLQQQIRSLAQQRPPPKSKK